MGARRWKSFETADIRRAGARAVVFLVAIAIVATAACSSVAPADQAAATNTAAVRAATGGSVTVDGITVAVPAGAVNADGSLRVAAATPETPDGFVGERIGSGVAVELTDAELTGEATVSFPVPADVDGTTTIPVVLWEDGDGGWVMLPAPWTPGQAQITATTDHFSIGFLAKIDVGRWAANRADWMKNYVTGRADVAAPTCAGEQDAKDKGVVVESDGGDTVKWCFGYEGDRFVLKVANNRRTYAQMVYPADWEVVGSGAQTVSFDALIRSMASSSTEATVPAGKDVRIVDGGDTVTFAVPSAGRLEASVSFTAWALTGIKMGVDVYAAVSGASFSKVGAAASGSWSRVVNRFIGAEPMDGYTDAVRECGKAFLDNPLSSEGIAQAAPGILKAAFGCVPALMTADLTANGPNMFAVGTVLSAVGVVVGTVLTAANLIVTGIREIWDSIASFGGKSDAIYDIRVTKPGSTQATGPGEYTVTFDHPGWGPVRLVTHQESADSMDSGPATITVYDAAGTVRYVYANTAGMYSFAPIGAGTTTTGRATIDATGNIFIDYNPGRHNGVIVLRPTPAGFDSFESLPLPGDYATRFYSARVVDTDTDGTYEIEKSVNDCEPDCASGTSTVTVFAWDGSDYVARAPDNNHQITIDTIGPLALGMSRADVGAAGFELSPPGCGYLRQVVGTGLLVAFDHLHGYVRRWRPPPRMRRQDSTN